MLKVNKKKSRDEIILYNYIKLAQILKKYTNKFFF